MANAARSWIYYSFPQNSSDDLCHLFCLCSIPLTQIWAISDVMWRDVLPTGKRISWPRCCVMPWIPATTSMQTLTRRTTFRWEIVAANPTDHTRTQLKQLWILLATCLGRRVQMRLPRGNSLIREWVYVLEDDFRLKMLCGNLLTDIT